MTFSTKTAGALSVKEQCFSIKDREKGTGFLQNTNNELAYPFEIVAGSGGVFCSFHKNDDIFYSHFGGKKNTEPLRF